ncbi:tyrosine-protein phosphatase [uncultured Enterococcus sp.]|uniref:tyrosine-protein phosphatase n=1 Tax=uncultured Enterococcus sp. TaxID=167972 RepID=UPI002AA63F50|nr:tyrosine-protein phosphatase [uncultured Enterococcus sp.]
MMKPIEVYRENDELFLDLKTDFTGELPVYITSEPDEEHEIREKLYQFKKGVSGPVPEQKMKRIFYKTVIDEVSYLGAERRLPITGLYNCRDLGGYLTVDGRMTKWGLIYRSDAPDHLASADWAYLKNMKISSVIDLRSPAEIELNPDITVGEKHHYNFDPHALVARKASETPSNTSNKDKQKVEKLVALSTTKEGQEQLIQMQQQMVGQMRELVLSEKAKEAYTEFLQVLLRGEVPDLFHCQGGKDRTGWAAAIILGLLGVDKATIYADYFLTEQYNHPRNEKRMAIYKQYTDDSFVLDYLASLQQTKAEYLDSAFQAMEETYSTMENYAVQALEMTEAGIEKLQELYLY